MTSAELTTPAMTGQVIVFTPPATTFITSGLLERATAEACCLPAGWFAVGLVRETGDLGSDVTDFVAVDQVRGPRIGDYQVRRERGRFLVLRLDAIGGDEMGFFRTMAGAFRAIRSDVDATWSSWGMAVDIDQAFHVA